MLKHVVQCDRLIRIFNAIRVPTPPFANCFPEEQHNTLTTFLGFLEEGSGGGRPLANQTPSFLSVAGHLRQYCVWDRQQGARKLESDHSRHDGRDRHPRSKVHLNPLDFISIEKTESEVGTDTYLLCESSQPRLTILKAISLTVAQR